jgi:hypothetical protein
LKVSPHATRRRAICRAMSVKAEDRRTAAATIGPRGAGRAYINFRACGARCSRYSKRELDDARSSSNGSQLLIRLELEEDKKLVNCCRGG